MTSAETHARLWPILVFQSRYCGAYEGGEWFALANCEEIPEGPWDDDEDCADWFGRNEKIVGVGDSPDEAVSDLLEKDRLSQTAERLARGEYRIGKSDWIPS